MKKRRSKKPMLTPDLTPLIDVVFLLLIFFMLVTTFDKYSGFKVELPTAGITSESTNNIYELIIDSDKKYHLKVNKDSQEITLQEFSVKLLGVTDISITADKTLPYDIVVKSIGELKKAGIDKVELNFYE